MATRNISRRTVAVLSVSGLLLYTLWVGWPYLHAVVVRDAAVTSWLGVTNAPIAGYTTNLLYPGERTGEDGRIATVADTRADGSQAAHAEAELATMRARVSAQAAVIAASARALDQRAAHATAFASVFSSDLEATMVGATASLAALQHHLELDRAEAARQTALLEVDATTQSEADAANANAAEYQRRVADAQTTLDRARARLRSAGQGVFLLEDGTDGNTAFQNLSDARVRLVQAQETLTELRAEEDALQRVYDKTRSVDILVPPGAMVWSLIASPGTPVTPGAPVASWVDCRVMLVDAPVSDVEAALLRPGSMAQVVIEGESAVRAGVVLLSRGSAGALGSNDLAALAKGRRTGIGQALVRLTPSPDDVSDCVIGRAAYVDFPEIGVINLLRARLRMSTGAK